MTGGPQWVLTLDRGTEAGADEWSVSMTVSYEEKT